MKHETRTAAITAMSFRGEVEPGFLIFCLRKIRKVLYLMIVLSFISNFYWESRKILVNYSAACFVNKRQDSTEGRQGGNRARQAVMVRAHKSAAETAHSASYPRHEHHKTGH